MYYESFEGRRPRRRSHRRPGGGCLGRLAKWALKWLVRLLIVFAAVAAVLYFLPVDLFLIEPDVDLSLASGLPSSPYSVLLLGVDSEADGMQRSDAILIASVDRENVRLTSIERDVMVDLPGHGRCKLNAVYSHEGPEAAVKMVNERFGLNITKYAVIDFCALVEIVDALGGIEVDITADEMKHINGNVLKSRKIFEPLGYTAAELKTFGERTHLTGLQALAYARIRKLDSDFVRMQRQRITIRAVLARLRTSAWNPVRLVRCMRAGLRGVRTNLNLVEIASLGEKCLLSESFHELRLPIDETYRDEGGRIEVTDWSANREKLYTFLYDA